MKEIRALYGLADRESSRINCLLGIKIKRALSSFVTRSFHYISVCSSGFVVLATGFRILSTIRKLKLLLHWNQIEAQRNKVWAGAPGGTNLQALPLEIQTRILVFMDTRSICRLSQTSKYFARISCDNHLWIKKVAIDWPDYSTACPQQRYLKAMNTATRFYKNYEFLHPRSVLIKQTRGMDEFSPGYHFYRQRYLSFKRFSLEPKTHLCKPTLGAILTEERNLSLGITF
jgi:hypothetical protein